MKRINLTVLIFLLFWLGCSTTPESIPITDLDPSYARRGEYLAKSLASCGFCHGETATPDASLSGGRRQVDYYGEATAPNLTPDATGLLDWDINRLRKAIRHSIREEDSGFSPYFHRGFEWLSDTDAISIAAYLQTLPPVTNDVERREVGFLTRNTVGIFRATAKNIPGYVPEVPRREELKYGEYLVDNVARCGYCHNSPSDLWSKEGYLRGGHDIVVDGSSKVAPAIIGAGSFGIDSWSEQDIIYYLRNGITPDKRQIDSTFCPTEFYGKSAEIDLQAISKYLKSITG